MIQINQGQSERVTGGLSYFCIKNHLHMYDTTFLEGNDIQFSQGQHEKSCFVPFDTIWFLIECSNYKSRPLKKLTLLEERCEVINSIASLPVE